MNLIFLYGPPAVGKLSIAKELKQRLGYGLLYNHLLSNPLEDLFSFSHPTRNKLVREFRLRIIEESIKDNLNLIITTGTAGSPTLFDYFTELIHKVESSGGEVYLVHLTADNKTLLERVDDAFRKEHGKHFGKKELQELIDAHDTLFDKYPERQHLTIDTRTSSAKQSAEKIIEEYYLNK